MEIGSSVTGNIGVTEIVSQDEDDVGRSLNRLGQQLASTRGKRRCAQRGATQHSATRNL
jgi:hypothetical protein